MDTRESIVTEVDPAFPIEQRRLDQHLSAAAVPGAAPVRVFGLGDAATPTEALASWSGKDHIAVLVTGSAVLLGPFGGGADSEPPCALCLVLSWQRLRPRAEQQALECTERVHTVGVAPFLTPFAMDAVTQIISELAGRAPQLSAVTAVDLNLLTLRPRVFPVIGVSECASCRWLPDGGQNEPGPVALNTRPKPATDEYRLRRVHEYDLPVGGFVNPAWGVLSAGTGVELTSTMTAPVTGRTLMRTTAGFDEVTWSGQTTNFATSEVMAVLEGLERFASIRPRPNTTRVVESYRNLAGQAVDPRECGLYDPEIYRTDPTVTEFDEARPISWVQGFSLRDGRPVHVPEQIAYYGARVGRDKFVHECSNGCAIGSCVEEAALFGLLELIERDAFLLGWYGRAQLTEIDVRSCRKPATRAMVDRLELHGYDVRLFDNRIDLQVPVVTAVAARRGAGPGNLCIAAGSGFVPEDAVWAALSEIASYVPSLSTRVTARLTEIHEMARDFNNVKDLPDHAVLFGIPEMQHHANFLLADRPTHAIEELYAGWEAHRPRSDDLLDDLNWCRDVVADAGYDVVVVDQTCREQASVGLRSVCVIAPGLIPIDFGWRRQRALRMPRMRTAFRRAGWRPDDLAESDLHLVPHPFP